MSEMATRPAAPEPPHPAQSQPIAAASMLLPVRAGEPGWAAFKPPIAKAARPDLPFMAGYASRTARRRKAD